MSHHQQIPDLYPTNFEIDLNGKKNDYQATILISILDFDCVSTEYNKICNQLSPEDLERVKVMKALLFENDKEPVEIDFIPCILDSTNRTTELPDFPCQNGPIFSKSLISLSKS